MGQMHSKMHVYQIKCSNVGDYDIVYVCLCVTYRAINMDDCKSTLGFFFFWEIMLLIGIVENKPLLLCH
jgi:hypothetical protein